MSLNLISAPSGFSGVGDGTGLRVVGCAAFVVGAAAFVVRVAFVAAVAGEAFVGAALVGGAVVGAVVGAALDAAAEEGAPVVAAGSEVATAADGSAVVEAAPVGLAARVAGVVVSEPPVLQAASAPVPRAPTAAWTTVRRVGRCDSGTIGALPWIWTTTWQDVRVQPLSSGTLTIVRFVVSSTSSTDATRLGAVFTVAGKAW